MSYDPTQQVPPPQGYPPQPGYPTQQVPPPPPAAYPQPYQQPYPTPQPPGPQTYQQYATPPGQAGAGFDFNVFWGNLGRSGQVAVISGLVLLISLFIPWFSVVATCSGSLCTGSNKDYSYNAFAIIGSVQPGNANETFGFPLILVVILATLAILALPVVGALGKMVARQVQMFVVIAAGVALLVEIAFMFSAFGAFPNETGSRTVGDTTARVSAGPAFGFWLGLLVTLVAGGVYVYFGYIKKPAVTGYGALPYGQTPPYPGSQPYPTPYPGSQPYQPPTQYPSTPPYQPPTQYQQPPQYPGQPPQYPGQ